MISKLFQFVTNVCFNRKNNMIIRNDATIWLMVIWLMVNWLMVNGYLVNGYMIIRNDAAKFILNLFYYG